ncbi:MAG TPA: glutaredoxin family protein [Oxalicibacterium sp.]|nr:glutaredoxin family protein [Oxalicibacterium sp.]
MKNRSWLLISLLLTASAHAQLYRWVAPDGKVTYSDVPPPSSVRQVEKKDMASGPSTAGLPYELAQAVKANPVTLYTTAKCAPCDDARTMLKTRGIPYAEKTVNNSDEIARLKQLAGDQQLPFLTVGAKKQKGFESNIWDTILSAAGYPQSSRLPPDYQYPAPESAAPKAKPAATPTPAVADRPSDALPDTPPPAGNAPPGFRF